MKKSTEILGLSIISIGEGKELGTAKDIVVDAAKGEVAAIVVEDGKWYLGAKILPFTMIQGIGEYALTIESSTAVVPLSSLADITDLLDKDVRVKETKVLTKGGKMQGQVIEIIIDEQSGKITGCEIKLVDGETAIVPAERVITFGKDVLVICDENEVNATRVQSAAPESDASPVAQPQPEIPAPAPAAEAPEVPVTVTQPPVEQTPPSEPETAFVNESQTKEDLSKKFDEKHRKFVLGKKSTRRIEADNGELIVDQGGEITDEIITKAKNTGKFIELTMSIAP